jgi:hypothetical protein
MKYAALPVAALAAIALSACTSTPADPVAAPPAPAAPPASAATTAPPAEPSDEPTEDATTEPVGTDPVATKAPSLDKADWTEPMYEQLGCKHNSSVPDEAEIHLLKSITIGGERQTVVAASCPTTTSTNPVLVQAYAGGPDSEPLLTAGKGQSLRTAAITVRGGKLTLTSEALSDKAPLCCADLRIVQSYEWDGSAYTKAGTSTKPL